MSLMRRIGLDELLRKAFYHAADGTNRRGFLHGMRSEFLARSVDINVVSASGGPRTDGPRVCERGAQGAAAGMGG